MINGREERVYIVAQAAGRRHTRSGGAKRPQERAVVALQFVIDKLQALNLLGRPQRLGSTTAHQGPSSQPAE
jgi:hypothetical protein